MAHLTAITSPIFLPDVCSFIDLARVRHPHIEINHFKCEGAVVEIERTRYISRRELRNSESKTATVSIPVDTLSQMGVGIQLPILATASKFRGR